MCVFTYECVRTVRTFICERMHVYLYLSLFRLNLGLKIRNVRLAKQMDINNILTCNILYVVYSACL